MCAFTGISLPSTFDSDSYDKIALDVERLHAVTRTNDHQLTDAYRSFLMAWNGVAHRFRGATDFDEEFRAAISTPDSFERRYREERALFGCVVSVLSAIECHFMAAYCVFTLVQQEGWKLTNQKLLNKTTGDISRLIEQYFPGNQVAHIQTTVLEDAAFKSLSDFRNTLAHRGILPRHVFLSPEASTIPSNPKALAADFNHSVALDSEATARHVRYMQQTVGILMKDFRTFVRKLRDDREPPSRG